MELHVLAEKNIRFLELPSGKKQEVVDLLLIHQRNVSSRFGIFMSPLDAAICKQYLNRQLDDREKENKYEIRSHTDPAVIFNVREMGKAFGTCGCLIPGFAVSESGRLVVQGNLYSLASMPLLSGDMNWLFGTSPKPSPDVVTSAVAQLEQYGATDHMSDIEMLARISAEDLRKLAALAVSQIGIEAKGTGVGFAVYSPSRRAWRRLA